VSVVRLSHIGICVSDLEKSVAFYRDALGFRERSALDVSGAEADTLLELESVELRAVYLERDGTRIELLRFEAPESTGGPGPRPVNQLGLTHLSLRVDDLDAAIRAVEQAGGRCLSGTRIENARFRTSAVFVLDPDGLRIELLDAPGAPDSLPSP
jgi:glyoxylase I family protein